MHDSQRVCILHEKNMSNMIMMLASILADIHLQPACWLQETRATCFLPASMLAKSDANDLNCLSCVIFLPSLCTLRQHQWPCNALHCQQTLQEPVMSWKNVNASVLLWWRSKHVAVAYPITNALGVHDVRWESHQKKLLKSYSIEI